MTVPRYLLLLVAFLSLPGCNGRLLRPTDKRHAKGFTISSVKVAENVGSHDASDKNVTPKGKSSLKENPITAAENLKIAPSDVKELDTTVAVKEIVTDSKRKRSARHARDGSLVSVSWRVPHKKPTEKHPELTSDYSPPKTHPPSHN